MFFLPYRLDANRNGLPILTVLICLLCTFVYWQQYLADQRYFDSIRQFCTEDLSAREIGWLERVPMDGPYNHCSMVLEQIRASEDAEAEILRLSRLAKPIRLYTSKAENLRHVEQQLTEIYRKFDRDVPEHLTSALAYDPNRPELLRMLTATFSHADGWHLAGNLLFFYVFAAAVELVFGPLLFAGFVLLASFGTSLAYSLVMGGVEGALPTVGLSGVVMAAVAALGLMLPSVRIRCLLWVVVYLKILRIPALFLALWYIGWDIYAFNRYGEASYVNYVAHLSGALIGGLFGAYYLVFRRDLLRAMIE